MIYAWIWKKLPGTKLMKTIQAVVLIVAAIIGLWVFVFPNVQSFFSGDPAVFE